MMPTKNSHGRLPSCPTTETSERQLQLSTGVEKASLVDRILAQITPTVIHLNEHAPKIQSPCSKRVMSSSSAPYLFVIWAPDCTDAGAVQRRLAARDQYLRTLLSSVKAGIISTPLLFVLCSLLSLITVISFRIWRGDRHPRDLLLRKEANGWHNAHCGDGKP